MSISEVDKGAAAARRARGASAARPGRTLNGERLPDAERHVVVLA
ncbi:MAG TPA: hypothetical protein VF167_08190 [Longimicrobiaceae bacterium]